MLTPAPPAPPDDIPLEPPASETPSVETPSVDTQKRILSQTRASTSSGDASGGTARSSVTSVPPTAAGSSEEPSDDTPVPSGGRLTDWISPPLTVPRRTLSASITHDVAVGPSAALEILRRRSSSSSSSSHPSAAVTTDDTSHSSPHRSPSRGSHLRRLSASKPHSKPHPNPHPKPQPDPGPHLIPASDDESAPSLSGAEESTGEGSSAAETTETASSFVGSSLSADASDSAARASASASAGSDSSEPFPKPLPRSVTHRLVVVPQSSDSSSDNVLEAPTRTRMPLRRPPPTPLPPDSLDGGRYLGAAPHTITLTPQQVSALTHAPAPQQVSAGVQTDTADFDLHPSTPPDDGHSSGSDPGGSETHDQLSQLPQRPYPAPRTSSQRLPRVASYDSMPERDRRPSLPSNSSYSSFSSQSVRSEPLMHRRQKEPDRTTLHRSYSLTSGHGQRQRTTRPPRVEDVEAVYRNLIDLTAYPLSPLGELTGVGQPHAAGMYSPDLTPAWQRVAPRIRNTGGLAPHGSFTSRRSSTAQRSSTPPLGSSVAPSAMSATVGVDGTAQSRSRKATRGSTSAQSSSSGRTPSSPTKDTKDAKDAIRALKRASLTDPTADVSHLGDVHLSRNELDGLEHAAALGDQLAAYHLGRDGRRDGRDGYGHRRAISSGAAMHSARPPAARRPTLEAEQRGPEYLSFSSASVSSPSSSDAPRQGTAFFSGQRHRHA